MSTLPINLPDRVTSGQPVVGRRNWLLWPDLHHLTETVVSIAGGNSVKEDANRCEVAYTWPFSQLKNTMNE